jgi:hypothetical protein
MDEHFDVRGLEERGHFGVGVVARQIHPMEDDLA